MGKKLYVGNLTYGVTNSALEQLFAAYGTVESAQVIKEDRLEGDSGGGRGPDEHEGHPAVRAAKEQTVRGR